MTSCFGRDSSEGPKPDIRNPKSDRQAIEVGDDDGPGAELFENGKRFSQCPSESFDHRPNPIDIVSHVLGFRSREIIEATGQFDL